MCAVVGSSVFPPQRVSLRRHVDEVIVGASPSTKIPVCVIQVGGVRIGVQVAVYICRYRDCGMINHRIWSPVAKHVTPVVEEQISWVDILVLQPIRRVIVAGVIGVRSEEHMSE